MDFKTRWIPDKIIWGIFLLSLPLVYLNRDNIEIWNIAFLLLFIIEYKLNVLGGGDLKVLFPLLFVFKNVIMFMVLFLFFILVYIYYEQRCNPETNVRELKLIGLIPLTLTFLSMVVGEFV